MHRLPWLTKTQRDLVSRRVVETVSQELYKRHWGAEAPGESAGRVPRFYIMDVRGLFMAAGILRYTLSQYGCAIYYRGQRKDWEPQVALLRGTHTKGDVRERVKWLEEALAVTQPVFDPPGVAEVREALLQHYGLPTRWLDVVDNAQTAAWFAHHHAESDEQNPNGSRDEASGYISALACPTDGQSYAKVIDLRVKPSEWLRPHVQQAWAIRSLRPNLGLGRFSFLQVCTFIVPRALLRQWSAYDVFTPAVFFPKENEDKGAYYWRRAEETLTSKGLLPTPWAKGAA